MEESFKINFAINNRVVQNSQSYIVIEYDNISGKYMVVAIVESRNKQPQKGEIYITIQTAERIMEELFPYQGDRMEKDKWIRTFEAVYNLIHLPQNFKIY